MKHRFMCAAVLTTAALICSPVIGQSYPVKPVRMVIPFPPGGAVDALARGVGNELSKIWGQPVLIEGKPGAGGVTAAVAVVNSPADGYTIYMTDEVPLTITPFMQRDLPYDPVKDFTAVIALVQSSSMFVVPREYPANNIAELITAAKVKPGAINYGTWGVGSTAHLDTEEFAAAAGVSMTHVPYKGFAEMSRGLLNGEIQAAFISLGAASPLIKQGRLKALAYGGAKRAPLLPEVPTMSESGLSGMSGFLVSSVLGFLVPSATPRVIVNRIAEDTGRALSVPAFKERFVDGVGFEVYALPPDPFGQLVQETRGKRQAQLKRLKLNVN